MAPDGSNSAEDECCSGQNIQTCVIAAVNSETFHNKTNISILSTNLTFHSTVPVDLAIELRGKVYKNAEGDEAVITYNNLNGNMFGTFKTHQDKSFALEHCQSGHFWKEFNVTSFGRDEVADVTSPNPRFMIVPDHTDNTTNYEYSVMFYVSFNFYFILFYKRWYS